MTMATLYTDAHILREHLTESPQGTVVSLPQTGEAITKAHPVGHPYPWVMLSGTADRLGLEPDAQVSNRDLARSLAVGRYPFDIQRPASFDGIAAAIIEEVDPRDAERITEAQRMATIQEWAQLTEEEFRERANATTVKGMYELRADARQADTDHGTWGSNAEELAARVNRWMATFPDDQADKSRTAGERAMDGGMDGGRLG